MHVLRPPRSFSSDPALPHRVNSHALRRLELKAVAKGMQVGKSNPMVGLEGRFGLLQVRAGKGW